MLSYLFFAGKREEESWGPSGREKWASFKHIGPLIKKRGRDISILLPRRTRRSPFFFQGWEKGKLSSSINREWFAPNDGGGGGKKELRKNSLRGKKGGGRAFSRSSSFEKREDTYFSWKWEYKGRGRSEAILLHSQRGVCGEKERKIFKRGGRKLVDIVRKREKTSRLPRPQRQAHAERPL